MTAPQNHSLDIISEGIYPAARSHLNDNLDTHCAPPPPQPACYCWLGLGSTIAYFILSQGLFGHGVFLLDALAKVLAKLA